MIVIALRSFRGLALNGGSRSLPGKRQMLKLGRLRRTIGGVVLAGVILLFSPSIQAQATKTAVPSAGHQRTEDNNPSTAADENLLEVGASGLPKGVEAMLASLNEKVSRLADRAALLIQVESLSRAGEHSYQKGDRASAEAKFNEAQEVLLAAQEELFYEASLHEYCLKLRERIAALKGITPQPIITDPQIASDSNHQVQAFVQYYQGKGRNQVRVALARLTPYEAMMREIFQAEGVPADLIYLGLVESAFNPYAHSNKGALGIWQFIQSTGARYGLKQVNGFDQRHDPEKSTRAAARYLRDLYAIFGDWNLALAGYNSGEYRVLRTIRKTGVKDFWQLSSRGLLPEETRNYVPAVLAAVIVAKRAGSYQPSAISHQLSAGRVQADR